MTEAVTEVGGVPLHVVVDGQGEPAVLLLAGLGEPWFDWDPTVRELAGRHRVVRYDRPGLGASPARRTYPTLAEEADRIAAVIDRYGLDQPVVVAHSAAALPAEAYARRHPGGLSGLVLVDPSREESPTPRSPFAARLARLAARVVAGLMRAADAIRLTRLIGPPLWHLGLRVTAHNRVTSPRASDVYGQGRVAAAAVAELLAYRDWAADLAALRRTLPPPPVPVVILTALGDVRRDRDKRAWRDGHERLAALFPDARQIVLADTGHLIGLDNPAAVADAVMGVLA